MKAKKVKCENCVFFELKVATVTEYYDNTSATSQYQTVFKKCTHENPVYGPYVSWKQRCLAFVLRSGDPVITIENNPSLIQRCLEFLGIRKECDGN